MADLNYLQQYYPDVASARWVWEVVGNKITNGNADPWAANALIRARADLENLVRLAVVAVTPLTGSTYPNGVQNWATTCLTKLQGALLP